MEDDMFNKIEAYINGEMNGEERMQFENEISVNSRLAQRVRLYKGLEQVLKLSESNKENENALRQTLSAVHNEYINRPGKIVPLRKINKWYVAAAAVLVIALSVFLFQKKGGPSDKELYAQYAVFPVLSGTRGSNDTLLARAVKYYNNNQFAEASPLLKAFLAADSSDKEIQLASYVCALQTGHFSEALQGFTRIAATENVFTYQARWYIALTYLKQDKIEECKKILNEIPTSADTFSKAQRLLKELR